MRTISYTTRFKKDYKREKKSGKYRKGIENHLLTVVKLLSEDVLLPKRFCDHPLSGEWKDHRDCHIKPDLILIYRKEEPKMLELVRLGSHSELGF